MDFDIPDAEQFCVDYVKTHDQDSYLSTLLAPSDNRRSLFAIYAFRVEIDQIIHTVSESPIGEIRLQWWLDCLDKLYVDGAGQHLVADEMKIAIDQHDLPKHLFANYIIARRDDLYAEPVKTKQDLADYLTATDSAIIDLCARTVVGLDALELADAIEAAGQAMGITSLLRTLPAQLTRKRCLVPLEVLEQSNLSERQIFQKSLPAAFDLVLVQMRHAISQHLETARSYQTKVSKAALPAFYPTSICDLYIKALADEDHDPMTMIAEVSQLSKQWHLFKKSWLEKF